MPCAVGPITSAVDVGLDGDRPDCGHVGVPASGARVRFVAVSHSQNEMPPLIAVFPKWT